MTACRHPYAHQRIMDVAQMDGTIAEERWCTLCGHIFDKARPRPRVPISVVRRLERELETGEVDL